MPAEVQLIVGPARSGKTQRLLEQYRQQLSRGQTGAFSQGDCFWLVPNQAVVAHLRDQLLETATTALLQPNLCTFAHFAETLITRSQRRIRPISQAQKRRLLQHAIRSLSNQGELKHFADVASTPGFVIQVDEFIAELKRNDIWPEAFEQRLRLDRRSRELQRIYAAYQEILHCGELYDAEGRFWAAREILSESTSADQLPFDLLVVNGFNDFTAAQYDILRLLSKCSSRLLISLTVELGAGETASGEDDEALLFAKTSRTLACLRKTLPQLAIESLAAFPTEQNTLGWLQHQLFRDPLKSSAVDGPLENVEIVAANSALGEVEAIAEQIKTLLQAQRAQPQEIVVVCQGGERIAETIAAVFPDYGIPFSCELRPRLEAEPLVRCLTALLRLHQEDWPFQTLLEVINNRLLTRFDTADELATSFETQPRVAMESCVRSAQLPSGKQALLEQLEYRHRLVGQGETNKRRAQVAIALGQLRQLDQSLSALPVQAKLSEWIQVFETLLAQLGTLSSPTASDSQVARTWQLLRRGLLAIAQVDRWNSSTEQALSLPEVHNLTATIARDQRVPAQHDAVGRVRVLAAESARKLSVKHLFLAGLSEQAFASAAPAEASPAADDSQSLLADLSDVIAGPDESNDIPTAWLGDGMLLFYELATRATGSLTLSYPALDAKGQSLPPSPLLTELQRSVGENRIPLRTMALGEVVNRETLPLSRGSFRRQAVDQALAGKQRWLAGMISQPDFVRTGSSILGGLDCVAQRSVRDAFGPYEGLLLSEAAQTALAQRFNAQHLWSPSQLESYATCPFRFFSEHLLGLEPLSELALSNDARRRGSLLHQVLATIHQQLKQHAGKTASDAETQGLVQRFLAALNNAVKATPLRGLAQSLREIERREIEAWAPSYAEQESRYRKQWDHLDEPPTPAYFEVRFGPDRHGSADDASDPASTAVPFELDLGEERICLTGQIDRVDVGRVGNVTVFNIIDYKSGKEVKLKLEKVRTGYQLQLPLYALAAEQLLLADQEAVALATGYWNIQGKGFETARGGSLHMRELTDQALQTSDAWKELQPEILRRVQELVGGIRGGEFPVYNEDEHCTRSCSLSTVCHVAQVRSLEKVWPPEAKATVEGKDGQ